MEVKLFADALGPFVVCVGKFATPHGSDFGFVFAFLPASPGVLKSAGYSTVKVFLSSGLTPVRFSVKLFLHVFTAEHDFDVVDSNLFRVSSVDFLAARVDSYRVAYFRCAIFRLVASPPDASRQLSVPYRRLRQLLVSFSNRFQSLVFTKLDFRNHFDAKL